MFIRQIIDVDMTVRLEIFSKSLATTHFLPLILTGSEPGKVRWPSRPEHRGRQ